MQTDLPTAPGCGKFAHEVNTMKKLFWEILSYLMVALLAVTVTLTVCRLQKTDKLDGLQALLERCYIGDMDEKAVEDAAAAAMVDALGDRWSHYQTAEQYSAYQDAMSNSYVGVGITIQVREDGQGLDITQVEPEGPAAKAGVLAGDRLVGVDGQSIIGMTTGEVSKLVRGQEGTSVTLELLRQEQKLELPVLRLRLQTVVATGQLLENNIGLVTIANFDDRCASETIAIIEDLQSRGATSLIFDVRNNPGGYKRELVKLLDYLLPEGALFRTVDYRGDEQVDYSDEDCLKLPMAVLVNLHSYSASEFFAAALSEYDAALVVGEKTFGKGYYQNTYELKDGSAVTLSIGEYFTPEGKNLAGVGLTPDLEVPVDEETAASIAVGTLEPMEDPQILAAIDGLKTGK